MAFITFIYKVGNNNKTYYGKYCNDFILPDHNGLDNQVKNELKIALKKYRKQNKKIKLKIMIGVLSFSPNIYFPTYSSSKEKKCFDFYRDYDNQLYINGNLV